MSVTQNKERALKLIDEMLDILDQADNQGQTSSSSKKEVKDDFEWNYLKGVDDKYAGKNFRVTKDLKLIEQAWKDCQLGPNDDLKPYCGQIGLCIQVEEEDNTLQLRWGNMDTCWIPAKACAPAGDRKPTIPGTECDWLPPPGLEQYHEDEKTGGGGGGRVSGMVHSVVEKVEHVGSKIKDTVDHILHPSSKQHDNKNNEENINEELFDSVEDDYIKTGKHVQITHNLSKLETAWKEAELGANDELKPYLGCVGKIVQIEEDDDTVQISWGNMDTAWFPIKACVAAPNKPLSIPNKVADWLTPSGIEDHETNEQLVEQVDATTEYYRKKQEESEQQES